MINCAQKILIFTLLAIMSNNIFAVVTKDITIHGLCEPPNPVSVAEAKLPILGPLLANQLPTTIKTHLYTPGTNSQTTEYKFGTHWDHGYKFEYSPGAIVRPTMIKIAINFLETLNQTFGTEAGYDINLTGLSHGGSIAGCFAQVLEASKAKTLGKTKESIASKLDPLVLNEWENIPTTNILDINLLTTVGTPVTEELDKMIANSHCVKKHVHIISTEDSTQVLDPGLCTDASLIQALTQYWKDPLVGRTFMPRPNLLQTKVQHKTSENSTSLNPGHVDTIFSITPKLVQKIINLNQPNSELSINLSDYEQSSIKPITKLFDGQKGMQAPQPTHFIRNLFGATLVITLITIAYYMRNKKTNPRTRPTKEVVESSVVGG